MFFQSTWFSSGLCRGARADDAASRGRWRWSATCSRPRPRCAGAAAMLVDASVRDVEELAELGLPIWARWVRVKRGDQGGRGRVDVPVIVGGAMIPPGDVLVLDADGVAVVERERARGGARASLERERGARSSARSSQARRALLRPRRPAREVEQSGANRRHRAPRPGRAADAEAEREPAFFVERPRDGDRGPGGRVGVPARWGDYQRYSLKLTESETLRHGGIAACAPRAPRRCERRVAAIEATGLGDGWNDGDHGRGPVLPLPRSRRAPVRALLRVRALRAPPSTCAPSLKNRRSATPGRGAAVKRLDHVNMLAADVRANRSSPRRRSATASTSGSSSTTAPRRAPG